MIDIQARLYLSEIIGLDGAADRINKAFSRVDDPISGLLKRGSQSLQEYITHLEDLATAPVKTAQGIKVQENALQRLVKIQERLNRAQGADNQRANTRAFSDNEKDIKTRSNRLRGRLEREENEIRSAFKAREQQLEQSSRREAEIRAAYEQENKSIDESARRRREQSAREIAGYNKTRESELRKEEALQERTNALAAKDAKADRKGDIQGILFRAKQRGIDDSVAKQEDVAQERLLVDSQKQRNKIVNEISSAQAKTRAEAEKLFEVDRKHNEAATEFNRRVGRTDVKPTTLGRDFAASTASFTNADPRHLADKLLNDPAFIAEYKRNLGQLVGKSTDANFKSKQSVVAAGVAARDFTKGMVDNLAGRGGAPPGGGGGGGVTGGLGGSGGNNPRRKAIDETNELKKAIDQSANSLNSFGAAAGLALRRFIAFRIGAQALYAIVGLFQQGASEAIKFEEELTKIQQTLDETDRGVLGLSDTIRGFARDVGTSAVEIAKGVRTFAQAGFDQVSQLEQVTSLISRIPLSTSFEGINETVEGSIAILGQFQAGLGDLGHIFDVTNQFAKDFAVESKDVFDAVKRAGSSFAIAGGSIEEFVALLSVLREGTRETGQILGTFFKTGLNQLFRPAAQKQLKQLGVDTTDTITNQLTQLGKTLFSKDSQFGSLQIIEIVRSLVGDSRQFPRLLALVRELSNDKTQDKIQNALQESSGSFIKDTEKRIDDFGISIKRAGQQIIDIFNEIIQNPAIKQLAKDFADLTENVTKLIRIAGPVLPSLFAGGAGLLFPTAKREIGRAGQFIRGFGFGRDADSASVSGAGNRSTAGGFLSRVGVRARGPVFSRREGLDAAGRLREAEEGFVPIGATQGLALGAGVAATATASLIRRNTSNENTRQIAGTIESAGLAFSSLVALGINPLLGAVVGVAVGLNALSDSIVKARKDVFEKEFKNTKGIENRIDLLLNNDVNPFLGGAGKESRSTQIINGIGRFFGLLPDLIDDDTPRTHNESGITNAIKRSKFFGSNTDVESILLAREEEFLRRLKDPQDRFGQGISNEIKNKSEEIFRSEKDSGKTAQEINRIVRFGLVDLIKKKFTFLDNSAAFEAINTILQDFELPKKITDNELIKPAKDFGDALRLATSSMIDSFRNIADQFKLAEEQFNLIGFTSSNKVSVGRVTNDDINKNFITSNLTLFSNLPQIFKTALQSGPFRSALEITTETEGVDEDILGLRKRLLDIFSIANNKEDIATKKFLEESFLPAVTQLSGISGKSEEDIVKDLLKNKGGLFDFVDQLSEDLGRNGDRVKKLTEIYNQAVGVINAQLDAQRRVNEETLKLGDSIFDITTKISSLENAIVGSNIEQSQLVSGRSNPTAIAEGILQGLTSLPNTQQLIGNAGAARDNVNNAFLQSLETVGSSSDISRRKESAERLLKAQNDDAAARQALAHQSALLENNLSLVSKAAEIFKGELLALRGTVDSAGKTISGLEKKDLNSIIVSLGKFAQASNGFTDISKGLSKINPQEFDFLQKGLEVFNNFKLPGGLSGADVLGDINKTLGVPALGAILRAASGGKISQSDAEAQINQQIADALSKQTDAQLQEQSIRLELISILQFNKDTELKQLGVLEKQEVLLQAIAKTATDFGSAIQTLDYINNTVSQLFGNLPQPVKIIEGTLPSNTPITTQKLGDNPFFKIGVSQLSNMADNYSIQQSDLGNIFSRRSGVDQSNIINRSNSIRTLPEVDNGRVSRGNFPTFRELNDRHGRNASPANRKSSNITDESIPLGAGLAAAGGISFDQFVKLTNISADMNVHLTNIEDTLKQIASAPAIQMSLEVKPMQVNVNVSVPDLLRLAGPVIAQQVIDKVAPAISEAFGVVSEEAQSRFDSGIKGTAAPEV